MARGQVWMTVMLGLVVIVAMAIAAALVIGNRSFDRRIADAVARLERASATGNVDPATLPPLVRDFARRAVGDETCTGRAVTLRQRVEMRLSEGGDWQAGEARHVAATDRTGFVWSADIAAAPLLTVRVVDRLVDGEGLLIARLAGVLRVAHAAGPEIDLGEAMRYLAELPWIPQAILCNADLAWRQVDERTVEVSTGTRGGPAAVRLLFDETGDVVATEADRPRDEDGRAVVRPWRGRFADYRDFGGLRLPAHGEVGWLIDSGPFAYFRGDIVSVGE